ncbi:outer membrane protein beta-barrel family protein [Kordia sp. SMS9]|uniref:outer membrane beta-barrel protein n=1 Tax=Kordia sp. SMS9 TaxID=2282170 RepID=UPI000E0D4109|nr:outer membrane beta-barrel protein [Kordia sp. SMS9]AXG68109.1 outer membrane protein beta-barrel family protein [Kordia sp. SMS9]
MNKPFITALIVLCSLLSTNLFAQEFEIKGSVVDKTDKTPLESATVYLQTLKDSTLITYTISDRNGKFELAGRTKQKEANLFITYTGFKLYQQKITLDKSVIMLPQIGMELASDELDAVQLVAVRAPITVKKDTLEFNADSFKTRPDATVEDLIKQLPGVEVDSDGKIRVNGKEVNKILVNGKPFFGDDPNIATKNLTKEIVDKIQVTTTKSEAEEFTGKKGTGEEQTINIELKEDQNKGFFGRATVSGGTDERYAISGIGNYFNDKQRVSVLASKNNINSSGFSFDEIYDMMGSTANSISRNSNGQFSINGQSFGGGEGITTTTNGGMSFVDEYKDKTEVVADYFYSRADSENESRVNRENILPDGRFFTNSSSTFLNRNDNHRANAELQFEIDSTFKIIVRPNYQFTEGENFSSRTEESLDEDGNLINTGVSQDLTESERRNFRGDIDIIKKFGSKGAFLRVGTNGNFINNTSENFLNTTNEIFGTTPFVETRDQLTDTESKQNNISADIEYRIPLKEKLFLDIEYRYSNRRERNDRRVFDFDNTTNEYDDFNESLSSDLEVNFQTHLPRIGINYETEKLYLSFNTGLFFSELENEEFIQNTSFRSTFSDININSYMNYRIKQGMSIYFNYNTRTQAPSAQQLQPVANVSNPLNITVGNPNLNREFSHNMYANFNNYDFKTRSGFFFYLSAGFTNDQVVPVSVTDENRIRTTTYTNVDGIVRTNGGGSFSKTVKKDSTSLRYSIGMYGNYNKNFNFSNGVKFSTTRSGFTPNIRLNYNYKELLEIEPQYSVRFNTTRYSLDNLENETFQAHTVGLKTTTFWPKKVVFGNDLRYTYQTNVAPGFERSSLFWNMSLGLKILNDKGTIKLTAYDILDQNINTRRTVTADFIQDSQSTVLQRYFMLGFTYKLSKVGGKKNNFEVF